MKVILWSVDGVAVSSSVKVNQNKTIEQVAARQIEVGVIPSNTPYFIVEKTSLPSESFRDAWRLDAEGNVSHDLDAAKVIAHEQRRAERAEALMPLDLQATYDLAGAEPLRQAIRNADALKQAAIDACTTIEELEGVCQA